MVCRYPMLYPSLVQRNALRALTLRFIRIVFRLHISHFRPLRSVVILKLTLQLSIRSLAASQNMGECSD